MRPLRNIKYRSSIAVAASLKSDDGIPTKGGLREKFSYEIQITVKNLQKKVSINPRKIKKVILGALSLEGINKSLEITVCFLNDKQIRELNLMYLGRDRPTDVIVFNTGDSRDKDKLLVDIAISSDTALRNGRIFKTAALYELYLYVVHGVLHILGYDDENEKQRKMMQDRASSILNALGITY